MECRVSDGSVAADRSGTLKHAHCKLRDNGRLLATNAARTNLRSATVAHNIDILLLDYRYLPPGCCVSGPGNPATTDSRKLEGHCLNEVGFLRQGRPVTQVVAIPKHACDFYFALRLGVYKGCILVICREQ